VEVLREGDTLQADGGETKQGARRPVRLQDDPVRPGAEVSCREVGKPVPASPEPGVDALDVGDQCLRLAVEVVEKGLEEKRVSCRDHTFPGSERAEMAVECLQQFKEVIERRAKLLHTSTASRTLSA
jgi:hypothetical protein